MLLATGLCSIPTHASGQEEVTAVLRGRVILDDAPVRDQSVQLHRVSSTVAGEIDSVRTSADGGFLFTLPHVPDPETRREVFFVSTRYQGILYFGAAIAQPADLDSVHALAVYDTAVAPADGYGFVVQTRNLFAEEVDGGWQVTDLLELRNDSGRTVVSAEGGAVWTYPLFPGATDIELGDGDLAPDAFRVDAGRVHSSAPVPPGTRLYVFRYRVPALEGAMPLPGGTERIELLVREPVPLLSVRGMSQAQPVEIEPGAVYRRYVGEDLRDAIVTFEPGEEPSAIPFGWLVVTLALVLGALGLWATRRPVAAGRAELLLEIARLDEAWDAQESQTPADRARYERRRERLLARIGRRR